MKCVFVVIVFIGGGLAVTGFIGCGVAVRLGVVGCVSALECSYEMFKAFCDSAGGIWVWTVSALPGFSSSYLDGAVDDGRFAAC